MKKILSRLEIASNFIVAILSIIFLAMAPPSCSASTPAIQVEEVRELVNLVAGRTAAYVEADADLEAAERSQALGIVERVKDSLVATAEASVPVREVQEPVLALCQLHDRYVATDAHLEEFARERYRRSTAILRRVLESAASPGGP